MKKNYIWGIITVRKQLYRTFKLFYMGGSNMKKLRNILALLMVVVMLVAVMPMNVFADEGETGQTNPTGKTDNVNQGQPAVHKIKIDAKNGSVMASVNGVSVTEAKENDEVALVATADNGYEFDSFTVTGAEVTVTNGKFTMPAAEVTVKATFKKKLETVKTEAKEAVDNLPNLSKEEKDGFKKDIDNLKSVEAVKAKLGEATAKASENAKAKEEADKKAKEEAKKGYSITVKTIGNGYADTDVTNSEAGKIVTVTAKPYSGYAVARVYYEAASGYTKNINTYFNDYYYNDYNYYYSDFINNYRYDYATYEDYLYDRHYSFWKNNYRYDNRFYDRYDNYYYRYLNDFRRNYSHRYDTYEEYLRAEHYDHYYNYRYLDRYDYRYHNYRYGYNTSDTFDMPASDVTVYVEFTDAYPYYYDDYYYYRSRRAKEAEEAKAKAEAAKKEEEAKAKAEAEKLPQVYENKAVIAIGSNVLDKVSKNVHTVHEMDTPAYVKDGRVMLPLRYIAEALGLQVSWVPETKTVIIWDLTQRVEIPVKSNRIIVNGITYTSDVKPEIKSSRTMLPIANIARALGLIDGSDIIWDQYNKQVTLTRKVLSK